MIVLCDLWHYANTAAEKCTSTQQHENGGQSDGVRRLENCLKPKLMMMCGYHHHMRQTIHSNNTYNRQSLTWIRATTKEKIHYRVITTHPGLSLALQGETVDDPHFGEHWTVGQSEADTEDPGPHLQTQPVRLNIYSGTMV